MAISLNTILVTGDSVGLFAFSFQGVSGSRPHLLLATRASV